MENEMVTQDRYSEENAPIGGHVEFARDVAQLTKKLLQRMGINHITLFNWEEGLNKIRINWFGIFPSIIKVSLRFLLNTDSNGPLAIHEDASIVADAPAMLTTLSVVPTQLKQSTEQLEKRIKLMVIT